MENIPRRASNNRFEEVQKMRTDSEAELNPDSFRVLSTLLEVKEEEPRVYQLNLYSAALIAILFAILTSPWVDNYMRRYLRDDLVWIAKIVLFVSISCVIVLNV
jgi:hypothetical protein